MSSLDNDTTDKNAHNMSYLCVFNLVFLYPQASIRNEYLIIKKHIIIKTKESNIMLRRKYIFILFILASFSVHAECNYFFQKASGKKYGLDNITTFVTKEIRPVLKKKRHMFDINILKTCDNETEKVVTIGMQSDNYYILKIDGKTLPDDIVRYDNRLEIDIDRKTLIWAIEKLPELNFNRFKETCDAKTYAEKKALMYQHAVLKMFAFVLAEAPRFESAQTAVTKTIEGNCSIDWHDFDFALHNWRNLSDYIKLTKTVEDNQISNNWKKPLYAPITLEQETAFEKALLKGEKYEFYKKAPFFEYEYVCP